MTVRSRFVQMLLITLAVAHPSRAADIRMTASLTSNSPSVCVTGCADRDAVVFVHGIYGDSATFRSAETGFDWPTSLPGSVRQTDGLEIDVYRLNYQSALISWARQKNPDFIDVATAVSDELRALRRKGYRSIGFIAHSLGGNLIATYLHEMKTQWGHAARAQHAYVITLGTPVLGSDVASMAHPLKKHLGINDALLDSLKRGHLFLTMLNRFREMEKRKSAELGCHATNLHAGYEQKRVAGLVMVVSKESAALSVATLASSPIVGFERNHFQIAKPRDDEDLVYRWVLDRVIEELIRVREWDAARRDAPADRKLCQGMSLLPER